MITIDFLKNHPQHIPALTDIWFDVLGRFWSTASLAEVKKKFSEHLNYDFLPLTFIALDGKIPIGMCSLRKNDGIREDLTPWLGSLVVDSKYQKRGIAQMLIEQTKKQAITMGYQKLYLFAFDPSIPNYYQRLGWTIINIDTFKGHKVTVMQISL